MGFDAATNVEMMLSSLTRGNIVPLMLKGTTAWAEKIGENWMYLIVEKQDVYDNVFNPDKPVTDITIWERVLTQEEKDKITSSFKKRYYPGLFPEEKER